MTQSAQGASAPTVFNFNSTEVRAFADDNGEPWFSANDVCKVLGYANSRKTVSDHCREGGVTKRYTPTESGDQEMTFINEGNLYRLIIKSRKPEAQAFEQKLMEEILPAIRRTGNYSAGGNPPALPAPVDPITPQLRKAIERHAYALTVEGFDRTRDSLEQYVRNFIDRGWTEEKILKEVQQMGGILGDLKVVTVEELWDLCQNMSMAMMVMEKVMGQVRRLEEKVGHELYTRPRK